MIHERKDHPTVNKRGQYDFFAASESRLSARPLLMIGLIEKLFQSFWFDPATKSTKVINEEDDGRGRCFQTAGTNSPEIRNWITTMPPPHVQRYLGN
jgi:hypothetical protein